MRVSIAVESWPARRTADWTSINLIVFFCYKMRKNVMGEGHTNQLLQILLHSEGSFQLRNGEGRPIVHVRIFGAWSVTPLQRFDRRSTRTILALRDHRLRLCLSVHLRFAATLLPLNVNVNLIIVASPEEKKENDLRKVEDGGAPSSSATAHLWLDRSGR
jgi:hypothetical protein